MACLLRWQSAAHIGFSCHLLLWPSIGSIEYVPTLYRGSACVTPSLRQIKYFVATSELGQVSKASAELSVAQSAITMAIKELERALGAELFRRSSQGMELTPAGRRFLSYSYEILAKVDEAMRMPSSAQDTAGTIAVAATYTVLGYFLPFHLEKLRRLHPNLRMEIHEFNRETIEEGLIAKRFDIAVLLTSNVFNPELTTETLLSSVRRVWVSSQHPLRGAGAVSLERIAQEPYIMLTVDEIEESTSRLISALGVRLDVAFRTRSVEAVRSLVATGSGVALLPDLVYRPWSLEGDRIEIRDVSGDLPSVQVGLAWRRGAPIGEVTRDFIRSAQTAMARR